MGIDALGNKLPPEIWLDSANDAVNVPIGRQADRPVIAVLVHAEQWVIQRAAVLFWLARGPKLRNRPARECDAGALAALHPATLVELRRVGIAALVTALGPVGMARFLRQLDPRDVNYTAQRHTILGNPTVDGLMAEVLQRK